MNFSVKESEETFKSIVDENGDEIATVKFNQELDLVYELQKAEELRDELLEAYELQKAEELRDELLEAYELQKAEELRDELLEAYELQKAEELRDELLEALEELAGFVNNDGDEWEIGKSIDKVWSVIAKAKGE